MTPQEKEPEIERKARHIANKLWNASGICNDTPHGMIRDYIARGIMAYAEQEHFAPSVELSAGAKAYADTCQPRTIINAMDTEVQNPDWHEIVHHYSNGLLAGASGRTGWIEVSKELPERPVGDVLYLLGAIIPPDHKGIWKQTGGSVLSIEAIWNNDDDKVAFYISIPRLRIFHNVTEYITHWQPLPSPPSK